MYGVVQLNLHARLMYVIRKARHHVQSQKSLQFPMQMPFGPPAPALPVLFAGGGVDDGVGAAVPHGGGAHRAGVGQDVDVVAAQVLAEAAVRQVEVGGRAPLPQLVGGLADRHHLGVGRRVARLGHLKEVNDFDSFMIG